MKKYKRGFTFVELLAVISVLIILAALFIPRYLNLRRESNRIVCNTNIDTLATCYRAASAMNPDADAKELLAGVLEDNSDISCPLGYSFITGTHDGSLFIICPEHGNKSISGADLIVKTISDDMYIRVYSILSDISSMSIGEKRTYFENLGYDAQDEYMFENSFIYGYLMEMEYNESWPVISDDYAKKHKTPKGLTIQPYIGSTSKPEHTLLFAAQGSQPPEMIYIDGTWYYRNSQEEIPLTKSYDTIVRNVTALWEPIL